MGFVFRCPVSKFFLFEDDVRKVTLNEDEVVTSCDNFQERTKQIEENLTHSYGARLVSKLTINYDGIVLQL